MSELTKNQIRDARSILNRAAYSDIEDLPDRLAQVLQYATTDPGAPLSGEGIASLDGDLIEKAIVPYLAEARKIGWDPIPEGDEVSHTNCRKMLEAAARVIADALLSPLTTDEKQRFGSNYVRNCIAYGDVDALLESRRALIEPKPKTPEERVTITINAQWARVLVDGIKRYSFEKDGNSEDNELLAELLRLGLIEQLKQKEAK